MEFFKNVNHRDKEDICVLLFIFEITQVHSKTVFVKNTSFKNRI